MVNTLANLNKDKPKEKEKCGMAQIGWTDSITPYHGLWERKARILKIF